MKNKIVKITMLLLSLFIITSCGTKSKKEEEKKESMNENTTTTIVEKDETGVITSGEVEGYKFTVSDEVTDRVAIQMASGDTMLIVLSNKDTPLTIANFKELVKNKFYDGLTFHRVYKDFMIQGGDPKGDGTGGSPKKVKGEFKSNGVENNLSHTRGIISMARSNDPNSASSQFFIMHADNTNLDGNYASFGRLIAGYNVLDKIANIDVTMNSGGEMSKPLDPPVIKSIRFVNVEKVN